MRSFWVEFVCRTTVLTLSFLIICIVRLQAAFLSSSLMPADRLCGGTDHQCNACACTVSYSVETKRPERETVLCWSISLTCWLLCAWADFEQLQCAWVSAAVGLSFDKGHKDTAGGCHCPVVTRSLATHIVTIHTRILEDILVDKLPGFYHFKT